jgi:ERCC4-type nuclease
MCAPGPRAARIMQLQIVADSHEQYPYRFSAQQAAVVKRALQCGDYGLVLDDRLVGSVERKSLPDLVTSLSGGRLRFALAELAALPRAAVVVEDRYFSVFKLEQIRPAVVADDPAELQVRWPNGPIVFCETRRLAEEWTYRLLAVAHARAAAEDAAVRRMTAANDHEAGELVAAPRAPEPSTAEVRAWADAHGTEVPTAASSGPRSGTPGDQPRRTEPHPAQ